MLLLIIGTEEGLGRAMSQLKLVSYARELEHASPESRHPRWTHTTIRFKLYYKFNGIIYRDRLEADAEISRIPQFDRQCNLLAFYYHVNGGGLLWRSHPPATSPEAARAMQSVEARKLSKRQPMQVQS